MRDEPEPIPSETPIRATDLWAVGIVALLVRVASLLIAAARSPFWGGFVVDDRAYHEWALRLARGEDEGGVFFLSPLLSHVLAALYAAVGERPAVWLGIQAVLGAFTAVSVTVVGARVFGRRAGLVGGGLVALHGPLVFATESVLTETLHLALVWGALLAWPRAGERGLARAAGVGLLAGLAVLARNYFVLALPLWVLAMWPRGRAAVLAFAAGAALGIAPATVHNLAAGEPVLVTNSGGVNLWLGNHPGANGRMHLPPGIEAVNIQDPSRMQRTFRAAAEAEVGRELSAREVSSHFRAKAVDWMLGDPDAFLGLVGARMLMTLEAFEHPGERNYYQAARFSPLLRWAPARWPLVLGLAIAGLFALRGRLGAFAPVAGAAAAALAALLLFWVTDRFRLALVPPLAVLAGGGVEVLLGGSGRVRVRAGLAAAATLALSLGLSWGRDEDTTMSHYNLGKQYQRLGAAVEAEFEARAALERAPRYAPAHDLLVKSLLSQGRTREAQAASRVLQQLAREQGIELRREPAGGR